MDDESGKVRMKFYVDVNKAVWNDKNFGFVKILLGSIVLLQCVIAFVLRKEIRK